MTNPGICTSIKSGDVFGKYTATHRDTGHTGRKVRWVCVCECGAVRSVLAFSLRRGESSSCGCGKVAALKSRWNSMSAEEQATWKSACNNTKHGLSKHLLYGVWSDMKSRCLAKAHKWYPSYGGRGIGVCDAWLEFPAFLADMADGFTPGLQLGRKNNDAGYSPLNCRWETPKQNQNNKSNNSLVETPAGLMTVAMASDAYGVSAGAIRYRKSIGYSGADLVKPSSRRKS